jgi:hypothetical protein
VFNGDGGNHGIGGAYRLAATLQLTCDFVCELSGGKVERKDFLAADVSHELLNAVRPLHPLQAGDDFHHGNR